MRHDAIRIIALFRDGRLLGVLVAVLIIGTATGIGTGAASAQEFPALTGRVVDAANILSRQAELDLTRQLAQLEAETDRQLVVATIGS
ncbi:MAG: hypothetical protein AAF205_07250, partial [Pseudomonadota bacterium]